MTALGPLPPPLLLLLLPQVFAVFSELVAGACRAADEGCGAGGADGSAGEGRTRMEDELMIFVRKQLNSAQGQHRRIGIIGTVALVQASKAWRSVFFFGGGGGKCRKAR